MPVMNFPMIYADEQGETHFGVQDLPDREVPFGPPPNPTGQMTDFGAVATMFVFSVPAHNAPQPYIAIILSGEGELVTSDRGEITDRIRVDTHAYAVMLGGPERRHLFICTSGSHDPAEIHRNPSASFQVVEVDVPGAGIT
jgi:hypothetical protein